MSSLPERQYIYGLLQGAAMGNQQMWKEVVDRYSWTMLGVTRDYGLTGNALAEVCHTTWLKLLGLIDKIEHPDEFRSLLVTITRHECVRLIEEIQERDFRAMMPIEQELEARVPKSRARRRAISPERLTTLAAFVAGPERSSSLLDEWRSHLSGEARLGLAWKDQIRAARGFLLAAVRYRLQDTAALAWRPVDALLGSRMLSNLLVMIPTAMAALFILRREGTIGVVTSAEGISAIGGALYMLVRVGRWWRNVKPPEPKARRVKE